MKVRLSRVANGGVKSLGQGQILFFQVEIALRSEAMSESIESQNLGASAKEITLDECLEMFQVVSFSLYCYQWLKDYIYSTTYSCLEL